MTIIQLELCRGPQVYDTYVTDPEEAAVLLRKKMLNRFYWRIIPPCDFAGEPWASQDAERYAKNRLAVESVF